MNIDTIKLKEIEASIEQEFNNYLLGRADRLMLRKSYQDRINILDEWFNIFVENVNLNPLTPNTPEWDLYNLRYKEWELYDDAIKRINIYTS